MSDVPTSSLRFVRRKMWRPAPGEIRYGERRPMQEYTVNILQQAFHPSGGSRIEWRDVPVIDEPANESKPD